MSSRRHFLRSASLIALAPTVPDFLARSARAAQPRADDRVLVIVELNGGNDGVNTVVPFGDEGYAKHRKALRLRAPSLIRVADGLGLHPSMADASVLLESGRLAIVQGVGYPNPSRSHFESLATWQTARTARSEHTGPGWLGRVLEGHPSPLGAMPALSVGSGLSPVALRGRLTSAAALDQPEDFALDSGADPRRLVSDGVGDDGLASFVRRSTLDAYAAADRVAEVARVRDAGVRYPETTLAHRLRTVSRLLKAGVGARVYYTAQTGYDTHAAQLPTHAALLEELSGALRSFLDDLAASGLDERVLVLCFSEFGRRVAENASAGTDHGTAGPVFLAGPGVKAGLVGPCPSLIDLPDGDLKGSIDFRRVYATLLERWLRIPSEPALGGRFEPLSLIKS